MQRTAAQKLQEDDRARRSQRKLQSEILIDDDKKPSLSESPNYPDSNRAMSLSKNDLGITSMNDLVDWTGSYMHFKQALEMVAWKRGEALSYLDAFPGFRDRFKKELIKQRHLEARLPKAMRDKIAANKPNLKLVETILFEHNKTPLM